MKFSLNWLREFVDIPGDVDELARLLTFAGVEIEEIEKRGTDIPSVVVAQINASSQHPNADRLSVCDVDDGTSHHRQIVCGAKNYKVGDKVFVALPGAELPNGLKIKVSKLRGVESQGMLCSPIEIAISEESDGLLILSPNAEIGAPIASLYPPDVVLDVEITPNRSDLLSYLGLAREVAAIVGRPIRLPVTDVAGEAPALQRDGIVITALRECPFYSARRIENVKVGPSPDWLRAKLESAGLRSINNIVDVTNFVMLELGQPLHAFDADKLKGGINVRLAQPNEKFLALDGRTYALAAHDLIIADEARAVAIGGVMGGEDTGVTEATRNVVLESACFLPSSIRRTARTLNLPSDASYRFERGVDPAMTLRASQRATKLMCEIADGTPAAETMTAGTLPTAPGDVTLRYQRCNDLLGINIESAEIDRILASLGLHKSAGASGDASSWKIPTYRSDLRHEVDLIEEVIRVHGIDKIPSADRSRFTPQSKADRAADYARALRERLIALGLFEARTSVLISRASATHDGAVSLRNPLSEDHVALRASIVRGLLDVLARNVNMGAASIRLFELGNIFLPPDAMEKRALGLVLSGGAASGSHWRAGEKRQLDFFDLKGVVDALRIPQLAFRRTENAGLALATEILSGSEVVGLAGQLKAARASELGAKAPVFVAQIVLERFALNAASGLRFQEIDKFPAATRDIAMIVPEALPHDRVEQVIAEANEALLARVQLFDLFAGKEGLGVGEGRKSMAYTLTYRHKDRTLTNDEVTVVHDRIRGRLKSELGAELRE
ncbi:MAG: phenylalanine--tRNA ligase subunit beta [Verrucomicrobiota bacterium]|nr:phenylalanine--tRNA ligase subunit beta [Verrucomicrobiota bacterium]